MELVAFLGEDRENWGQINAIIKRMKWDKIILVRSKKSGEFAKSENSLVVDVDTEKPITELKENLIEKLKPKLADFEVALSLASGNGKEHMALISALLGVPVGVRLVAFTKKGIEFIN